MPRRKPTRRDLLVVIDVLQSAIGEALAVNNDRNPNRLHETQTLLNKAHELCIDARSSDPPIVSRLGPWGAPITKDRW